MPSSLSLHHGAHQAARKKEATKVEAQENQARKDRMRYIPIVLLMAIAIGYFVGWHNGHDRPNDRQLSAAYACGAADGYSRAFELGFPPEPLCVTFRATASVGGFQWVMR
jgi:hypothetical protein